MRQAVEEARKSEMERLRRAHPEIPEETLNAITRSLVNKIFHTPSERLRQVGDETLAKELANLFRRIDDAASERGAER
jgi:glutamyl-tRNA reductase